MSDTRRIEICLQFWEGDKEAAMRNARRIADNEPAFRDDVGFCFVTRFGTEHDAATVEHVSKKFNTTTYTSNRRGSGWPHGCNELACALLQESVGRVKSGEWTNVKAIFLMEADCIPVHREWLNRLHAEWKETENKGKWITGWWGPYAETGHINGNFLVTPNLAKYLPSITGCDARIAWDCAFARVFEPHWRPANFLENLYGQRGNLKSQLQNIVDSGVVLIHGVKDLAVEEFADVILRKN